MANDNQEYFPSIRKVVGTSGSVGTQTGTTAPVGTNTTQIATTAFVLANQGDQDIPLTGTTITPVTGDIAFEGDRYLVNEDENTYGKFRLGSFYASLIAATKIGPFANLPTYFTVVYNEVNVGSYRSDFNGIRYTQDYSANYTDRSLVDKEYVDSVSGGGGGTPKALKLTSRKR